MTRSTRRAARLVALVLSLALASGCALFEQFGEKITQAFSGVEATMTTYSAEGQRIDRVQGESFRISRDDRFDTSDSEGNSNNDSSVLLISLGDNHISHVGSTMILADSDLTEITDEAPETVDFTNADRGTPWLNDLRHRFGNLWQGKSKTIIIRSQLGHPVAVYAGDRVELFATDIPKATWFQVDGKQLLVYRADYTVYDNALLGQ